MNVITLKKRPLWGRVWRTFFDVIPEHYRILRRANTPRVTALRLASTHSLRMLWLSRRLA